MLLSSHRFQESSSGHDPNPQILAAAWCDLMATGRMSLDIDIMVLGPMAAGYFYNSCSDSGKSIDAYFIGPIQQHCRREDLGLRDTLHPLTHTHIYSTTLYLRTGLGRRMNMYHIWKRIIVGFYCNLPTGSWWSNKWMNGNGPQPLKIMAQLFLPDAPIVQPPLRDC